MRKILMVVVLAGFFLGGCTLSPKRSAIEINSYPIAKVYLDDKEVGMTPYKNKNLKPGEVEIRLETNDKSWSRKIKLQNNINTVIDWEFGKAEENSGGYILYLEKTGDKKKAGLMVMSDPSEATLSVDNEIKGFTPMKINNIGEGDRHLTITYPNHKNADVFVKAVKEYQLVLEVILAKETVEIPTQTETKTEEEIENKDLVETVPKVKIKETETGWLKVREASSSASREIKRVNPGETYDLILQDGDWTKIDLGNNQTGWVSSKYVEKN